MQKMKFTILQGFFLLLLGAAAIYYAIMGNLTAPIAIFGIAEFLLFIVVMGAFIHSAVKKTRTKLYKYSFSLLCVIQFIPMVIAWMGGSMYIVAFQAMILLYGLLISMIEKKYNV